MIILFKTFNLTCHILVILFQCCIHVINTKKSQWSTADFFSLQKILKLMYLMYFEVNVLLKLIYHNHIINVFLSLS